MIGRMGRLIRRWWPDRNPVRRGWDRAEAVIVAALAAAFLAGTPVAAITADHWAHGVAQHVQQTEQAAWRQVPAVLTAKALRAAENGYPGEVLSEVKATWTAPSGAHRAGIVLAPPGTLAGHQVKVWVDRAGDLTGPPLLDHQVGEQAALAAVVAGMLLGLLLLCAGLATRRVLDARRMAAWDAEWRVKGPRWRSRH
jgi:hypothetical protein